MRDLCRKLSHLLLSPAAHPKEVVQNRNLKNRATEKMEQINKLSQCHLIFQKRTHPRNWISFKSWGNSWLSVCQNLQIGYLWIAPAQETGPASNPGETVQCISFTSLGFGVQPKPVHSISYCEVQKCHILGVVEDHGRVTATHKQTILARTL